MTSQSGSSDRATVTTGPEGLSVTVGPGGVRAGGANLSIGLFFWLIAELWVGSLVWRMGHVDVFHFPAMLGAFPVVWLALWTIFGYRLVTGWLFAFWGRQQLIVGPSSVTLRATVLGQSRTQVFATDQVTNVRLSGSSSVSALAIVPGQSRPEEITVDGAAKDGRPDMEVAFEVRGKTYRFGGSLSASTARTIPDAIERSRKG